MDEFTTNYKLYQTYLIRFLKTYIPNRAIAEEIMQEAFIKAWTYREGFKGDSAYRTWLTKIAINEALNYLNKENRRTIKTNYANIDEHNHSDSLEDLVYRHQVIGKLEQVLIDSFEGGQDVFILHFVLGMTCMEVGKVLGIPKGTVKSRLHRLHHITFPIVVMNI